MKRLICSCIVLPALVVLPAASALATHPILLRQFTFAPPHSELNVTGGFAGINETLKIFGDFDLIIDRFPHPEPPDSLNFPPQAQFTSVEAKLVGGQIFDGRDLDNVLNLSGLKGTFLDDNTVRFTGEDSQGLELVINSRLTSTGMTLVGRNDFDACCDFFNYRIEAVAVDRYIARNLLPGDANNDGKVSGLDLLFVQRFFGKSEMPPPTGLLWGDANDDGSVTGLDSIAVQENFGKMIQPSFVPEPAAAVLLVLAGGLVAGRRSG